MSDRLPSRLPEWDGADVLAREVDPVSLRRAVADVIDLLLAEDTGVLDGLPGEVESALIVPLGILADVYDCGDLTEIVVAARLVKNSVSPHLNSVAPEVRNVLERLSV